MLKHSSVLTQSLYPAVLTVVGLVGNTLMLGRQIKDVKDDLHSQIQEVEEDIKEARNDIKRLVARQLDLELHDMSVAEQVFKDCGKNK